jgi:hypothetical protein
MAVADYHEINGSGLTIDEASLVYDSMKDEISASSLKPLLGYAVTEQLIEVLSTHFPNGFRVNSLIEMTRLRSFMDDDMSIGISITDQDLERFITNYGTLFNGKVYFVDSKTEYKIIAEVDAAVDSGLGLFFYSEFYERHRNWLSAEGIISEDMFRSILERIYPTFSFRTNYFTVNATRGNEIAQIEIAIKDAWGDDLLLNYEQVFERLKYVPINKIKQTMGQNNGFIWNNRETFTFIDKFAISDGESVAIKEYVEAVCHTKGYASIGDVPLGDIEETNYELSLTAIHNAVFKLCLADKYQHNGKIVIRKGDTLDALTIMKTYCRTLDKCSLKELLDYERELTGESHRWIPMEAGYAEMVRADEDVFISENYVYFDCEAIDNALDLFVAGEYLPLRSITTFAAFPHCGQAWNLFLLESYCRRFSKRYRFALLSVNSRNAGVIVRQTCDWSIDEVFADAVAHSDTSLDKAAIEDFLCSYGYIGRRSFAHVNKIIERVRFVREEWD